MELTSSAAQGSSQWNAGDCSHAPRYHQQVDQGGKTNLSLKCIQETNITIVQEHFQLIDDIKSIQMNAYQFRLLQFLCHL